MSCELKVHASLAKSAQLQQFLFRSENQKNWLQKCVIAFSPICDRVVVAYESALVLLTVNWETHNDEDEVRLSVVKQWDASENGYEGEDITSAICLPLVNTAPHSHSSPDWTCIALGFSSGFLRFFTEDLDLVMAELLHQEPLLQLRAVGHRMKKDVKSEGNEKSEAIYAVYPSAICSIPGFSLFQTLRGCRSQVALRVARGEVNSSVITPIGLFDKYAIGGKPVRDACFVGQSTTTMFDHLVSSSLTEGFFSKYRPSPPHHNVVVSTGPSAWLQFHHTLEGVAAPFELTDVAKTVWNKLPGWIGISKNKVKEVDIKPAQKMRLESRLLDRRREGRNMVLSPDGSLLAVTDSFGRVTLVDVRTEVAISIWKGYRDAECAFLEVQEELPKSSHRHRHSKSSTSSQTPRCVQLLIIYAPKKGLLEIFPLRHGPRVAALKVSKTGRLIYTSHSLLGFSTAPKKSPSINILPVTFLSEEGLFEIVVPFHCALMDTSARAKDLHLMKKVNSIFKESEWDEANISSEILSILNQLQTDEVRWQFVQFISSHRKTSSSLLLSVLDSIIDTCAKTEAEGDLIEESQSDRLLLHCKLVKKACVFYKYLLESANEPQSPECKISLPLLLCVSEADVEALNKLVEGTLENDDCARDNRVTFQESKKQTVSSFLHRLDFSAGDSITQKQGLTDEEYCSLGDLVFGRVSQKVLSVESWVENVRTSSISASFLAYCLLHYWLQRPVGHLGRDISTFMALLRAVISLSDDPVASQRSGIESPWWTELRTVISRSRKASVALLLAVCCRAVSLITERESESLSTESSDEKPKDQPGEDWERVSADTWQWDMLISNLEDVAVVNKVLGLKPVVRGDAILEQSEVSLEELLYRGEDALSQHIAKWICMFHITPNLLIDKSDPEFQEIISEKPVAEPKKRSIFKGDEHLMSPLVEIAEEADAGTEEEKKLLGYLKLVKKRFPYSLTTSVLLSHVGWELCSVWQQDPPNLKILSSAIEYLLLIPNTHLKAGICSLVWSTYMKIQFEGITRLLCQVGKLPTDILCSQEIGLPRAAVAPFLECAEKLLSAILDAISERPQKKLSKVREALWRDGPSGIVSVALSRPIPCEDIVLLHHQVTTIIHLVCTLDIKEKQVLSNFLEALKNELFGDLAESRRIVFHNLQVDDHILFILRRGISAAVQTIHEVESEDGGTTLATATACHWLKVCNDIATFWRFSLDSLRRQHVCELYACGYDRLAEEVLPLVNETQLLASALLVLAGQRVRAVIAASPEPQNVISTLSPKLTSWLDILGKDGKDIMREKDVSVDDTALLVNRVLQWLPEDHDDVSLATLLAECLIGMAT